MSDFDPILFCLFILIAIDMQGPRLLVYEMAPFRPGLTLWMNSSLVFNSSWESRGIDIYMLECLKIVHSHLFVSSPEGRRPPGLEWDSADYAPDLMTGPYVPTFLYRKFFRFFDSVATLLTSLIFFV